MNMHVLYVHLRASALPLHLHSTSAAHILFTLILPTSPRVACVCAGPRAGYKQKQSAIAEDNEKERTMKRRSDGGKDGGDCTSHASSSEDEDAPRFSQTGDFSTLRTFRSAFPSAQQEARVI